MTKILLAVAWLVLLGHVSKCQSFTQSTLTWSADQAVDVERGDTTAMHCTFKTIGSSQFVWSQRNGTINSTYQVTGVEGVWENVGNPGSVTLTVVRNGKTTKVHIERTSEGIFLILEFVSTNVSSHVKFRITNVDLN